MSAGTVVDTGIVHPRNYDFFMCAHNGAIVSSLNFEFLTNSKLRVEFIIISNKTVRAVHLNFILYFIISLNHMFFY